VKDAVLAWDGTSDPPPSLVSLAHEFLWPSDLRSSESRGLYREATIGMVRVMREDNPATEIANSLSECLNACGMLCQRPSEIQRDAVLDAVSWFIEAAPLDDLPTVRSFGMPKDMIRNAAAIAAKMQPLVLAWDGTTEPPPSLVSLAHEFLVSIGMEQLGIQRSAP
jgi:hypothetical protein